MNSDLSTTRSSFVSTKSRDGGGGLGGEGGGGLGGDGGGGLGGEGGGGLGGDGGGGLGGPGGSIRTSNLIPESEIQF